MKLQRVRTPLSLLCGILLSHAASSGYAQEVPVSAGSLDTGFFPGTVVTPNWNGVPTVRRIVIQPDGGILICGGFDYVQRCVRRGLARLLAGGSLDGKFIPGIDFIQDVALEPGGKIVAAGTYRGLARLNADGTLDASFDGAVVDGATAVARLPSGDFLGAIHVDNDPADATPRYSVALFDAQGRRSSRWSTSYRSASPLSYILVAPRADRVIVDGPVELSLANSDANFRWLTNSLPPGFRAVCGAFQEDGKLLVGSGTPSEWNYPTNTTLPSALVRLNTDGSRDVSFSTNVSVGVSDLDGGRDQIRIAAIAIQPAGRILIGGFFTRVAGEARTLVARLLANGQLDSTFVPDIEVNSGFDVDALQNVSAMSLTPEGKLLIGGVFSRCNGLECRSLTRLHTTADAGGGILAFARDTYYVWETNGPAQVEVLRYGPSNCAVSVAYEAPNLSPGAPEPVPQRGILAFEPGETSKTITLAIPDNLVAEGNRSFRLALSNPTGGAVLTQTPETKIAILDDETIGRPGSVDLAFPALSLEGYVYSVSLLAVEADGSALLFVQSTTNGYNLILTLMRVGLNGQIDPAFRPVIDAAVLSAFPDPTTGKILIVGGFSMVNGQSRSQVARLNHDGSLDPAFQVTLDSWVSGATVQSDGKLVLYGSFTSVNQVPRRQLARLNTDGTVDPVFDTSTLSRMDHLFCVASQSDGKIVIAGYFNQINGVNRTNLARLNSDGSLDASFVADATGSRAYVRAILCQPDGKLLVCGSLQLPDGRSTSVIRLNEDGSHDTTFDAAAPGGAQGWPVLLQPDGKIIVDGKWRLNPDGSRDYSFLTGEDAAAVGGAGLLPGGDLLVSGGFSTFAEWPRPWLVRIRAGTAPVFGFFEFADPYLNVDENAGTVVVGVRRIGPADQEATVDIATADATALANVDYTPFTGTLAFAPGVVERTVTIPIINRAGYQGSRFFQVLLQDRTAGIRSPSAWATGVFIFETEFGLTFSQTNYWIIGDDIAASGNGALVAYIQRFGDLSQSLTIQCQLLAGTAVEGQDFVATNMTLLFQPQQYEVMVIAPLLRNDSAVGDRTLYLVLNHPEPEWSLTTDATAMVTIIGKPRPPSLAPGGYTLDTNGCMRLQCDVRPGQFVTLESSTDLLNWTYLGYVYRTANAGPPSFEDYDAWKYARRFYRIPLSSGPPD